MQYLKRAFSSEVDTGSREENASNRKIEPPFRFNRNGKGSSHLHSAAARFASNRALIAVMLLGPVIGAMLAFGAVAAQDASVVTIDNFTFAPKELTIAVGTTVKFVNHDDIPHTVVEKKLSFRSKALDTDDWYSYTFATAGSFDYFCSLHPHMVGKIIVK
jgi:plastocyanin